MPGTTNLRSLREAAGLSREGLARIASTTASTINQLERGVIVNPSYGLVMRLSRALNVGPADLFEGDDIGKAVSEVAA